MNLGKLYVDTTLAELTNHANNIAIRNKRAKKYSEKCRLRREKRKKVIQKITICGIVFMLSLLSLFLRE